MKTGPYTLTNYKEFYANYIEKAAKGIVPEDEPVIIALEGNGEEYLICTNTRLFIIKKGALQGQFMGKGHFQIAFSKISSVEIDKDIGFYTLYVSAAGMPHIDRGKKATDEGIFGYQPNVIVFRRGQLKAFQEAVEIIMKKVEEASVSHGEVNNNLVADELIKLKSLMDQGVLTKEEFEAQKRKLLS